MLSQTEAIVIRSLKFKESSLIVTLLTREFGVKAYLVRGVLKSKKSGFKAAHFQLLNQLEMLANHNAKGNLNSIKELKVINPYESLIFDFSKQSLTLFIAELLYNAIKEEQNQVELYDFIKESLNLLDATTDYVDFHLVFMMRLTRFLGFYPELQNNNNSTFDLQEGKFVQRANNPFCLSNQESILLQSLMQMGFADLDNKRFNNAERKALLTILSKYYEIHLPQFGQLKSLEVLNEVYR